MSVKKFTLIEMLIVIAIIGILAGLIMPSLSKARASALRNNCLSNKKQLITAMTFYAGNNSHLMVLQYDDDRPYSWALRGYNESQDDIDDTPAGLQQMGFSTMICNMAMIPDNEKDKPEKLSLRVAGMLAESFFDNFDDTMETRFGKKDYIVRKKGKLIAYDITKIRTPSHLVLFADSFKKNEKEEGSYWKFTPAGDDSTVTTIHSDMTTLAYADGRAESLTIGDLKSSPMKFKEALDSNFEEHDLK